MTGRLIQVRAMWDQDAGVYIATSDDVPGLVAEADTPSALQEKLHTLIPELLELNRSLLPAQSKDSSRATHWEDVPVVITLEQV